MDYSAYARIVAEDLVRLKRRITASRIPQKVLDRNLVIGTWNIRAFGEVFKSWEENTGNPKRNLRAMVYIAEIIRHFDVIAIQEVKRDTSGLRMLLEELLGPSWGLVISDVSGGSKGNSERLTFIYDRRRVLPSGLAGEIVLPRTPEGNPMDQFDRTPYIVGFQSKNEHFALLTAHIRYGKIPSDRLGELAALAQYIAREIRARIKTLEDIGNVVLAVKNGVPVLVRDVGRVGEGIALKPGMFFTVEPMINLGRPHVKVLSDGWTAVTRDRSLSAQFEHTVGVTEKGVEVFTFSPAGLDKPPYKR